MIICNKVDGELELFDMKSNKERIEEYKRKKLACLSSKWVSSYFGTDDQELANAFRMSFELDGTDIYCMHEGKPYKSRNGYTDRFIKGREEGSKENVESYINGDYSLKLPIRVYQMINYGTTVKKEDMFYFIKEYDGNERVSRDIRMFHLLSVPRELYLLQMLELGFLKEVAFKDIDEQLKLFDYKYIDTIKPEHFGNIRNENQLYNANTPYSKNVEDFKPYSSMRTIRQMSKMDDLKILSNMRMIRQISGEEEMEVGSYILKRAMK